MFLRASQPVLRYSGHADRDGDPLICSCCENARALALSSGVRMWGAQDAASGLWGTQDMASGCRVCRTLGWQSLPLLWFPPHLL